MKARMEESRSAFKLLTDKPTGNRPLGRPRRKWEDNIRMNLKPFKWLLSLPSKAPKNKIN